LIGHDLSNCRPLRQDTNVVSSREKTIGTKIQLHYYPKVAGVQDETKDSLAQVVELTMEPMVEHVVEVQIIVNHDNICVVNGLI